MDIYAPRCYGGALFYKGEMGVIVFVNQILHIFTSIFPNFKQSGSLEVCPKKIKKLGHVKHNQL